MPVDRRPRPPAISERASDALLDTALGAFLADAARRMWDRAVPRHWTTWLGAAAVACFAALVVTGLILLAFYAPSTDRTVYQGSWAPLRGVQMSEALDSTLRISLDMEGGLLVRQTHHWAALLLPAILAVQLLATFFTGGFRKPRRLRWVLLFLTLLIVLVGGWSGYAMPDDMLSGTGLRIVQGVALGVPVLGSWASAILFGGQFPGRIIENLYPIHVVVVPVALIIVVAARMGLALASRPAQFPGKGRTNDNVVGLPLPTAAARALGLASAVTGLLFLLGATVTVAPIWLYGPSSPGEASAGSQPDWYTAFLDGALRLTPPGWEVEWLGYTWTLAILIPLLVVGLFLGVAFCYPFLEQWATGDRSAHNILDRPRNAAVRTSFGVAALVFYGVLWSAASADVASHVLHLSLESLVVGHQVALVAGPVIGFALTRRICFGLQARDRDTVLHGFESGRIVRLPGGEYVEVHVTLEQAALARLVEQPRPQLAPLRPDGAGRLTLPSRLRAALSRIAS